MRRFAVLFVTGATTAVLAVAAASLIGDGAPGAVTPAPAPAAPQESATAQPSAGEGDVPPAPAAVTPSAETKTATVEAGAGDASAPPAAAAPEAKTATAEVHAGDGDAPADEAAPESSPPEETTAAADGDAAGAPAKPAAAAVVVVEGGSGSESSSVGAAPPATESSPAERPAAREEGPVADSGGRGSVEGDVYTWQDGDRTLRVRLQADLTMEPDGDVRSRGSGDGGAGVRGDSDQSGAQPVFRSESGALMTLPGGILLVLDATWSGQEVDSFFARNSIAKSRVSDLGFLPNGFFVETAPGFPSLNLANALAGQDGVEISSPNWWTESTTR